MPLEKKNLRQNFGSKRPKNCVSFVLACFILSLPLSTKLVHGFWRMWLCVFSFTSYPAMLAQSYANCVYAHLYMCEREGRVPSNRATHSYHSIICNFHISATTGKRNTLYVPVFHQFYNAQDSEDCSQFCMGRDAICRWLKKKKKERNDHS